ncbi:NAD(P)-bd-dom domain-containing protein [Mycena kentingensis (nom. inval.)]|nr:NAD(P)-bd-dom domain-containing protein [Mycena kentingensis (nom. inval.)]
MAPNGTNTILITGATGKTGAPLVERFLANPDTNTKLLLATRSPPSTAVGAEHVVFDWADESTYAAPFVGNKITAVYLVAPQVPTMRVTAFIDLARTRGVRRFVLLSATVCEKGGVAMGEVHAYLDKLGVEYCALRPSWFIQNFATQYAEDICLRDEIVSATGTGTLGYVSTADIADVAYKALTAEKLDRSEEIIVGPELVSYDEIAQTLANVLGRKITHRSLPAKQMKEVFMARGMPAEYAELMVSLDGLVAQGREAEMYQRATVVGKESVRAFVQKNKRAWVV